MKRKILEFDDGDFIFQKNDSIFHLNNKPFNGTYIYLQSNHILKYKKGHAHSENSYANQWSDNSHERAYLICSFNLKNINEKDA